jgi:hypothetical protein
MRRFRRVACSGTGDPHMTRRNAQHGLTHDHRPGFLQALAQTALFYITVGVTCSLILLFALFNRRRRTLHDMLAVTVLVRSFPG